MSVELTLKGIPLKLFDYYTSKDIPNIERAFTEFDNNKPTPFEPTLLPITSTVDTPAEGYKVKFIKSKLADYFEDGEWSLNSENEDAILLELQTEVASDIMAQNTEDVFTLNDFTIPEGRLNTLDVKVKYKISKLPIIDKYVESANRLYYRPTPKDDTSGNDSISKFLLESSEALQKTTVFEAPYIAEKILRNSFLENTNGSIEYSMEEDIIIENEESKLPILEAEIPNKNLAEILMAKYYSNEVESTPSAELRISVGANTVMDFLRLYNIFQRYEVVL